ncbi:hypothetical protein ACLOJK_027721 [Asimina triloba]
MAGGSPKSIKRGMAHLHRSNDTSATAIEILGRSADFSDLQWAAISSVARSRAVRRHLHQQNPDLMISKLLHPRPSPKSRLASATSTDPAPQISHPFSVFGRPVINPAHLPPAPKFSATTTIRSSG